MSCRCGASMRMRRCSPVGQRPGESLVSYTPRSTCVCIKRLPFDVHKLTFAIFLLCITFPLFLRLARLLLSWCPSHPSRLPRECRFSTWLFSPAPLVAAQQVASFQARMQSLARLGGRRVHQPNSKATRARAFRNETRYICNGNV